jgi:hypothetical protein
MSESKDSAACEPSQVLASSMSSFQEVCDNYSREGYIGHLEKGLKLKFGVAVLCKVVKVAVMVVRLSREPPLPISRNKTKVNRHVYFPRPAALRIRRCRMTAIRQNNGACHRLCGLVARVPGYTSRGLGSIPCATRFSEK